MSVARFPARDEAALREDRQLRLHVRTRGRRQACPFCGLWYRHEPSCFLARVQREVRAVRENEKET